MKSLLKGKKKIPNNSIMLLNTAKLYQNASHHKTIDLVGCLKERMVRVTYAKMCGTNCCSPPLPGLQIWDELISYSNNKIIIINAFVKLGLIT
jgi:hypothetical protein